MTRKKEKKYFSLPFFLCGMCIGIVLFLLFRLLTTNHPINQTMFPIQSIDTMKYSRDSATDPSVLSQIPFYVEQIALLHANYIAIDTPYDEQFYPVLLAWVREARRNKLHIWFRGNFSAWEGWFGYKQMKNFSEDHQMVKNFILRHPELFQNGDIFTPVPEPENGVIGDPRGSDQKSMEYNQFLIDSYNNCVTSFSLIHKRVSCGYFSMNADIAEKVLTADTVSKIGHIIVIDHYVDNPEKMGEAIDYLWNKFHVKIMIGEFGGPIPDLNGNMNQNQQATFVGNLLQQIYTRKNEIEGVNYWTISGGSTSLLNNNGTARLVTKKIKSYFSPNTLYLTILNSSGQIIQKAHIFMGNTYSAVVKGESTLTSPDNSFSLRVNSNGYGSIIQNISFGESKVMSRTIVLETTRSTWAENVITFFQSFFRKF